MPRLVRWAVPPMVAIVLGGALWLSGGWADPERWPIRWLEVEGELQRVTSAQVRAAVAGQARRGFFIIDIERARRAVEELPWIADASVTRHWPDALQISIVEQRAVARWNDHELLGVNGEAFHVAGTDGMQGLARLAGPDSRRADVFGQWRQMQSRLAASGIEIRQLEMDARGAWKLETASGRVLLLGRDHIDKRLERYLSVRSHFDGLGHIRRIDLRYPNGLALIRGPERTELSSTRQQTQSGAQHDHG